MNFKILPQQINLAAVLTMNDHKGPSFSGGCGRAFSA